ncbi:MAG: hypothetical protein LBQ66_01850 [Planctomycetaceae bacterium]|nr:hypothetical protein [Planctomycetaceae bacterium]
MPTRFDVPFKLVRFYYAQRRARRLVIPHIFFCIGVSNHLVLRVRLGYEQHRRC